MHDEFAVLDTETTGLSPTSGDRVIEIAVVRIDARGRELDHFASLCNPGLDAAMGATHVHGITSEMLADAPSFSEVVGSIARVARGCHIVAHNAPFDMRFLVHELEVARVPWKPTSALDTLRAARALLPGLANYRLATVAQELGVPFDGKAHSALADARVTARVHARLLAKAGSVTLPEPPAWPELHETGLCKPRP